ncbi:hypothetical protein DPMN_151023 [Dreissena polymorpha]|uniref:Uncharacterized protein n=1 Tax=Dreissena polymorpha TaxID=45954 RepID=A0A9D4FFN8_DREPO|nr:hypothetical protein DPMN_151023 [Dreissena polymorpha]
MLHVSPNEGHCGRFCAMGFCSAYTVDPVHCHDWRLSVVLPSVMGVDLDRLSYFVLGLYDLDRLHCSTLGLDLFFGHVLVHCHV